MTGNRTNIEDVEIHVSKLEIGMRVVKLDRPWESTPFLMQGFVIHSKEDIVELQHQCDTVFIEVRIEQVKEFKEKYSTIAGSSLQDRSQKSSITSETLLGVPQSKQRVNYINKLSFNQAVTESKVTFDSARSLARSLLDSARVGLALDMDECRTTVEKVVDSVISNKDALRFLSMIKNKDEYTAEHSMNVCILSANFARYLGLQEFEMKLVALCGLLHDIGKARVPLEILNKREPFNKEEAHIMAEHTTYGRNILMATDGDQRHAVDVAHSHHERIDGKGYPRSLSARQIPYYAKLVCITDAYDAMTSERCYGKPKTSEQALRIIASNAGKQFDPELAHAFIDCIGFYPVGGLVELSSGPLSIIFKPNDTQPDRPMLLVVTDETQKKLTQPRLLDLAKPDNEHLFIGKQVLNKTAGIDAGRYISRFVNKS